MKLPIAWLRDYLDFDLSTDEVAERFAALGFPVDHIERRPKLAGVTIGRLARVEKHPDADRLQVCSVDVGGPQPLTIATAASNVAAGDVVPVATIGAELVGLTIGPRKMRGIASEGMLCSAGELGLEAAWFEDGILHLEPGLPIGADAIAMFGLNDDVLDVEITANRVDAMSILGLARELGASLGTRVREPSTAIAGYHAISEPVARVTIESSDCKRFVAQRVSGVVVRPAPFWMRVRLALAGQRPIDNLVDISNFVMLETAQPLHFYDFDRIAGHRLVARDARAGETIRTLDEADRALDERFLVIADEREPQGIAGLKGGAGSEIAPATTELLIEAATFSGPRIRRMSVALGLRTEASSRHEKGLALGLATLGAARAAHLLEREGARVQPPFAVGADDAPAAPIHVPLARFKALLGIAVNADEATSALEALGFTVREHQQGASSGEPTLDASSGEHARTCLDATPPAWRNDIRIPEDVVEEVARIVGYDRIEAALPPVLDQQISSDAYRRESQIAHALAALGYREAITLALQPAAVAETYARAGITAPGRPVEIRNPLSEDQRYLRFALLPALLALAAKRGADVPYRAFEIGHEFAARPAGDPVEIAAVTWLLALPRSDEPAWRDNGFLTFKGEALALVRELTGREADATPATSPGWHPGKSAALSIDDATVATIGAVDPRLLAAYGIEARVYAGRAALADVPAYRAPRYAPPSKFPAVARDLALVVAPDVAAIHIERAIRAGDNGVVASVRVFDEYRGPQVGEGLKSLAVRVLLQRDDATLTDADADAHVAAMLERLRERCGARIRS